MRVFKGKKRGKEKKKGGSSNNNWPSAKITRQTGLVTLVPPKAKIRRSQAGDMHKNNVNNSKDTRWKQALSSATK